MKEMKLSRVGSILLGIILVIGISAISYAAIPETMSYQGYLTDLAGDPVNGTVEMTFRIYDSADPLVVPVGSQSWIETHTLVQVNQGVYSVQLGSVSTLAVPGLTFDVPYWLGVEVETDGEMDPRQPFDSVPFAVISAMAENATSAEYATSAGSASSADFASSVADGSVNDNSITGTISSSKIEYLGLNADFIDDMDSTDFANVSHIHESADITQGSGSTLDADFLDGQDSTDFADASHSHGSADITAPLNLTMDAGGYTIYGINSYALGIGVRGDGGSMGVWGQSGTSTGVGVYGAAISDTGFNYGVYGFSQSDTGHGVHGKNIVGGYAGYFEGPLTSTGIISGNGSGLTNIPAGPLGMTIESSEITDGTIVNADVSLSAAIASSKIADGIGSGLDADLLDGQDGTFYIDWANLTNMPAGFADGIDDVGDDLGNHIASSNIFMGSHYISSDGGDEGIQIDPDGNTSMTGSLDVGESAFIGSNNGTLLNDAVLMVKGGPTDWRAGWFEITKDNGTNTGIVSRARTGAAQNWGISAEASWATSRNTGVEGQANGITSPTSTNYGLKGHGSNGANSYGVYGSAYNGTTSYGIYGKADGTNATTNYGVYGEASGGSNNYGGYFSTTGDADRGVSGIATGNSGRGVEGLATATGSSTNYGGYFSAAGNWGRGVYGAASAIGAVANYGGFFSASGDSGRGVYGYAPAYGGDFEADGDSGIAVQGVATATGSATNYGGYFSAAGDSGVGVYGKTSGLSGHGVYGETSSNSSTSSAGVYGSGLWKGVKGVATCTYCSGTNGGYFEAISTPGSGVGVVGRGNYADFQATGPGINYDAASSIRWKRNIVDIDGALNKVMNMRGVYYDWDEEHGGQHDMGFIAEEVGEYIPEIVSFELDSEYATGLDYGAMTPVLLQAIKEQQGIIEAMKGEIEELREEIKAIKEMI